MIEQCQSFHTSRSNYSPARGLEQTRMFDRAKLAVLNMQIESAHENGGKRGLIIAEATRLFNEQGYADTRLEDIGDRLGTVKTSISYYFKSKDGLLQEAYESALTFSETALANAAGAPNGRGAVLAWIRAHARAHADALGGLRPPVALIADLQSLEDSIGKALLKRYRELVVGCRDQLMRGHEDGSIGVRSIDATLFFLVNMLHWLPRWLGEIRPDAVERAINGLLDLLENGLANSRARPNAPSFHPPAGEAVDSVFDREARNRIKREAFLRTGTRALNARGYRSLSLNEIAAELGVTRGAFYYHIADKDALLRGCFERSCDLIEAAQEQSGEAGLSALDHLECALRRLYDRQVSNLDPLIRLSLLSALEPSARALVETRLDELRARFARILANAMVDGSAREFHLIGIDQLVMGTVFAGSHRRLEMMPSIARGKSAPGFSATAYLETLFYGLIGQDDRAAHTNG
ncbi:MAG: TetR family transcriptional regulator [Wenzhouxiangellaceae bacterium]|nr:TetR family transcriptional regulator [Wenzhouxiangellaceae bacterium]